MNQIDKNIAFNLKKIRKAKNMSLDMLAEQTGVSKSMLGQIERGESNPTVSTIGKIVEGLKVPFEDLLYAKEERVVIVDRENLRVHRKKEGEYCFYLLLPYQKQRMFEVYEGTIIPGYAYESGSHGEKTWEYVTVLRGRLNLYLGEESYVIHEGDSVRFSCDCAHKYSNKGIDLLRVQIVLSHEH